YVDRFHGSSVKGRRADGKQLEDLSRPRARNLIRQVSGLLNFPAPAADVHGKSPPRAEISAQRTSEGFTDRSTLGEITGWARPPRAAAGASWRGRAAGPG